MQLSGFWQSVSEGGQEPDLVEINDVFGYETVIVGPGQQLANEGRLEAVGDEVLSSYWVRVDNSKPVTVRQIAAYHGGGQATVGWWPKGNPAANADLVTHRGVYRQSLLPLGVGAPTTSASFNPSGAFGFEIQDEWSDPALNDHSVDISKGCVEPCGHHVRFWPLEGSQRADHPARVLPDDG